ncbi:hypothetical protein BJ508DRAFT_377121 [Ascobolus immersus RN42]|uniref:Uncharacterized protein n=1 Tax=Ascobolus immersus RN42 TaxID=1160509 RepID=A0A3N4I2V5_ASCIM|nr:hypothetical protein BJ508DRAFT_377121 [Ascobolus immersus RN42]
MKHLAGKRPPAMNLNTPPPTPKRALSSTGRVTEMKTFLYKHLRTNLPPAIARSIISLDQVHVFPAEHGNKQYRWLCNPQKYKPPSMPLNPYRRKTNIVHWSKTDFLKLKEALEKGWMKAVPYVPLMGDDLMEEETDTSCEVDEQPKGADRSQPEEEKQAEKPAYPTVKRSAKSLIVRFPYTRPKLPLSTGNQKPAQKRYPGLGRPRKQTTVICLDSDEDNSSDEDESMASDSAYTETSEEESEPGDDESIDFLQEEVTAEQTNKSSHFRAVPKVAVRETHSESRKRESQPGIGTAPEPVTVKPAPIPITHDWRPFEMRPPQLIPPVTVQTTTESTPPPTPMSPAATPVFSRSSDSPASQAQSSTAGDDRTARIIAQLERDLRKARKILDKERKTSIKERGAFIEKERSWIKERSALIEENSKRIQKNKSLHKTLDELLRGKTERFNVKTEIKKEIKIEEILLSTCSHRMLP